MSEFKFKGWDWGELADCWGITVNTGEESPKFIDNGDGTSTLDWEPHERIEKTIWVGDQKVTFTTEDEEVILETKIIQHMSDNLGNDGEFIDPQMRTDIHNFLEALIEQSKNWDYHYPVYEGILKIESDSTLVSWMRIGLTSMWT